MYSNTSYNSVMILSYNQRTTQVWEQANFDKAHDSNMFYPTVLVNYYSLATGLSRMHTCAGEQC